MPRGGTRTWQISDESIGRLGDGKRIKCVDEGTVRIPNRTVGRDRGTLVIESTLVVPELERNLISVYVLMRSGYDVNFRSKDMSCWITHGRTKIVAVLEGNLWIVRSNTIDGLMEGIAYVAAASHFTRGANYWRCGTGDSITRMSRHSGKWQARRRCTDLT